MSARAPRADPAQLHPSTVSALVMNTRSVCNMLWTQKNERRRLPFARRLFLDVFVLTFYSRFSSLFLSLSLSLSLSLTYRQTMHTEEADVSYEIELDNVLHRLRYPRFLLHVRVRSPQTHSTRRSNTDGRSSWPAAAAGGGFSLFPFFPLFVSSAAPSLPFSLPPLNAERLD